MAQFTVHPPEHDPYPGHRFRVIWDGRTDTPAAGTAGAHS